MATQPTERKPGLTEKRARQTRLSDWVAMLMQLRFTYRIKHPEAAPGNCQVALDHLVHRELDITFGAAEAGRWPPPRYDNCRLLIESHRVAKLFDRMPPRFISTRHPARMTADPVLFLRIHNRLLLLDGRRRLNAMRRAGRGRAKCYVIEYLAHRHPEI